MLRPRRTIAAAAVCAGALLGATTPTAGATMLFSVTPILTVDPATVGQTNLPASLVLANNSDGTDASGAASVIQIRFTPSCGAFSSPPCISPEPGVITVSPNGTGALGTACAGINFPLPVTDNATGEVGTDVPPGTFSFISGQECRINFTYSVMRSPAIDSQPGESGIQTDQILQVRFFHPNSFDDVVGLGSDFTAIAPAPAPTPVVNPPASTQAPAQAPTAKKCKRKSGKRAAAAAKKCRKRRGK